MTVDPGKAPREGTPQRRSRVRPLDDVHVASQKEARDWKKTARYWHLQWKASERQRRELKSLVDAVNQLLAKNQTGMVGVSALRELLDEKKPPRRAATAEEEGRHQTPRPPDPTGSA